MMKCPNCGNEIDKDLLFCPSCGERLRDSGSLDLTNIDISRYSSNTSISKDDSHEKSRTNKPYIAIFCVLVIGIAIWSVGRAKYGWKIDSDIFNNLKIEDPIETEYIFLTEGTDNTLDEKLNDSIVSGLEYQSEIGFETEPQAQVITNEGIENYKIDESDIRTVQALLSQAGYSSLAVDGKLGPKTKE